MRKNEEKSYLAISDEASKKLRELIFASEFDDPVIIFFGTNEVFDGEIKSIRIEDMESLLRPLRDDVQRRMDAIKGLKDIDIEVSTASRHEFPAWTIVDIDGIPINAPLPPHFAGSQILLDYLDGVFRLRQR